MLCSRALVLWVFFGLAMVVPVYTSCVLRGALRFFNKVSSYLSKKKKKGQISTRGHSTDKMVTKIV
jgi:hypothetical protein